LLPLTGVLSTNTPISRYLEFPPLTRYVSHAPFSWPVFLAGVVFLILVCSPFFLKIYTNDNRDLKLSNSDRFPWWGVCGLILTTVSWYLAWNRFTWFNTFQPYTFTPLWLGYILTVNGLAQYRSSSSLLTSNPGKFLLLFPISSLFWWYFEYLNRFVQNWYYVGVENFTGTEYIVHASICFSTVLPAVMSTLYLLATFPRLSGPLSSFRPISIQKAKFTGFLLLLANAICLSFISIWPDYLFPLIWISPLFIFLGIQLISGRATLFAYLTRGDWRPIWLSAMAALVCGLFWEMWNWQSLAHWEYSVPFVHRFQVFAMPVLGYGGYLPFGVECYILAGFIIGGPEEHRLFFQ